MCQALSGRSKSASRCGNADHIVRAMLVLAREFVALGVRFQRTILNFTTLRSF
jgi:hypothetical protein